MLLAHRSTVGHNNDDGLSICCCCCCRERMTALVVLESKALSWGPVWNATGVTFKSPTNSSPDAQVGPGRGKSSHGEEPASGRAPAATDSWQLGRAGQPAVAASYLAIELSGCASQPVLSDSALEYQKWRSCHRLCVVPLSLSLSLAHHFSARTLFLLSDG